MPEVSKNAIMASIPAYAVASASGSGDFIDLLTKGVGLIVLLAQGVYWGIKIRNERKRDKNEQG